MKMSAEIGEIAMALSKAQGQLRAAPKDRENPFFKSAYATLASVIEAIREPLAANSISFSQPTRVDDHGRVYVTTILMHGGSGQWISGEASAAPTKQDPQGIGSLISYLKRYGLQAMVGIASEDDDAHSATRQQAPPKDDRRQQMKDDRHRQAGQDRAAGAQGAARQQATQDQKSPPKPKDAADPKVIAEQQRLKFVKICTDAGITDDDDQKSLMADFKVAGLTLAKLPQWLEARKAEAALVSGQL